MHPLTSALILDALPGVGPARIKYLSETAGSLPALFCHPEQWLAYLPEEAQPLWRAVNEDERHPLHRQGERELEALEGMDDVVAAVMGESDYPSLLAEINTPPPLLYVRGNTRALELPQVAMVGSRNPTAGGGVTARDFAHYLAAGGFGVTSGLALGIDGCAHRGAVDAGGVTVAVMGTGIDCIYPARHRALAEEIVENDGALVTAFAPGTRPEAKNFPERNRIISGLSLGTMVVEAALKSGSLITARYALEQQREVFAVPGSINNPMSRGCHALIKTGAKLVETAEDIVEELGGALAFKRQQVRRVDEGDTPAPHWLLEHLGHDPVTLDELCRRSGASAQTLGAELMELELEGLIAQRGSFYQRV